MRDKEDARWEYRRTKRQKRVREGWETNIRTGPCGVHAQVVVVQSRNFCVYLFEIRILIIWRVNSWVEGNTCGFITHLVRCLVPFCMPVEIGESRAGATKESRDMSYERKVSTVAFLECVKVHHVKLADIDGYGTVSVRFSL